MKKVSILAIISILSITACSSKNINSGEPRINFGEPREDNPVFTKTIFPYLNIYPLQKFDYAINTMNEIDNVYSDEMMTEKIIDYIYEQNKNENRITILCENQHIEIEQDDLFINNNAMTWSVYKDRNKAITYAYMDDNLYKLTYQPNGEFGKPELVTTIGKPSLYDNDYHNDDSDSNHNYTIYNIPKDYLYYSLYIPKSFKNDEEKSIARLAESLYLNTIKEKYDRWSFILNGTNTIDGNKVYNLTAIEGKLHNIDNVFSFSLSNDGDLYRYDSKPILAATIPNDLSAPQKYKQSIHATLGGSSLLIKYEDHPYTLNVQKPIFKTNGKISPDLAAFGIYTTLLKDVNAIKPNTIQNNLLDGHFYTTYANYMINSGNRWLIDWVGVDTIDGHEALEFLVSKGDGSLDLMMGSSNRIPLYVGVTDDKKIYTYEIAPVKDGKIPIITNDPTPQEPYLSNLRQQRDEHPETFINQSGSYQMGYGYIIPLNIEEIKGFPAEKSIEHFKQLIHEYKGEDNNTPWKIIIMEKIVIDNEEAYRCEIGQVQDPFSTLKRMEAALSKSGKLYTYKDGKPELLRQVDLR